jgi:sec-independent protein translocase protein TatA
MDLGWPELLIIAVVVVLLFGSKKLPDVTRSIGKSMRILKTEIKGLHDDQPAAPTQPTAGAPTALPPADATSATPPATAGERTDAR